jgi:hypothetical protein
MNNKELHIWMGENYPNRNKLWITLESTEEALNNDCDRVDSTQTHVCSTKWLVKGYKIFVHMLDGEVVEIVLGSGNKHTNKEIRIAHNLEKLLLANCFGYATRDNWSE